MEKRLQQIMARKAEIREEIQEAPEERLAELTAEADRLLAEEAELRVKLDLTDRLKPPIDKPDARGGSEIEERARTLRQERAITITNNESLIRPTENQQEINGMIGAPYSSIADLVKITDCHGMSAYQVPYLTGFAEAKPTKEGEEVAESDPKFAYAEIKPSTLATYSEVSRETQNLTNVAYYNKVVESARIALRKLVATYIVTSGTGDAANFTGILKAEALTGAADVALEAINERTLRTIAMNYGGDESIVGNAVLFLNKKDLVAFGDVRGDKEKKYIYEITPNGANPNVGIIKDGGLSVQYCLTSSLTPLAETAAEGYSMFYGTPGCYEVGLFGDFNVRVSEDAAFRRRMIAVLGEVMIGGNVVVKDGFVRVKKS